MDVAWFAPSIVLLAGSVATVLLLRRIAAAADQVGASQRRVRRLEDALIPVRVDAQRARRSIDRLDRR